MYIEYIQTAPWNNRRLNDNFVRFAGCGSILIHKAIRLSRAMSMGGRIGLHSLQSSIGFYERAGMSNLGFDFDNPRLTYFEMTPQQADNFTL